LKALAIHGAIQFAGDHQDTVADRFGFKAAAVHAPEIAIVGVDLFKRRIARGSLAIGGAGDDQSMKRFERLPVVAKFDGEPVEQFGVGWQLAVSAEIVRRFDDSSTEMI